MPAFESIRTMPAPAAATIFARGEIQRRKHPVAILGVIMQIGNQLATPARKRMPAGFGYQRLDLFQAIVAETAIKSVHEKILRRRFKRYLRTSALPDVLPDTGERFLTSGTGTGDAH